MLARAFSVAAITAGLALGAAPLALAQMPMPKTPASTQKTVTGTVVDVSCRFGQGLGGADHRMCAQVCADKGIPLAILGTDGQLYIPVSTKMPGESQNALLKDFAEQEVTVSGTVFAAGGANAIQIASIKRKG
jgi:hypothetical protein